MTVGTVFAPREAQKSNCILEEEHKYSSAMNQGFPRNSPEFQALTFPFPWGTESHSGGLQCAAPTYENPTRGPGPLGHLRLCVSAGPPEARSPARLTLGPGPANPSAATSTAFYATFRFLLHRITPRNVGSPHLCPSFKDQNN